MSRTEARANAFILVYEHLISEVLCKTEEKSQSINPITFKTLSAKDGLSKEDNAYTERLFNGVMERFDTLTKIVSEKSKGFALERVYNIDLAIMLVALYEILYQDDVPAKAAINEAIELSKEYSTEKSRSFINGILASALEER